MRVLTALGGWLIVVLLLSCSPVMPPGAVAVTPEGRWVVDTDPQPMVVGDAAGVSFEYIASTPNAHDSVAGDRVTLSASCVTCTAAPVEATAQRYASLKAEELYHPDAVAGFTATLTLPQVGTWRIAPFDVLVEVRAIDAFEPPLVILRPSSAAPAPGCGRAEVAALVRHFQDAYNSGDSPGLADVVEAAVNFSIAGGAAPVLASGRDAFVGAAVARHAVGERIVVTRIFIAREGDAIAMAIYAARTASDLPATQRLFGKATMSCAQPRFGHLNLGAA